MKWKVLIAHANGEEHLAEKLAKPLREGGYQVVHTGTVVVGQSIVAEASKVLQEGGPVVLCGTVRAVGTGWARTIVNAARRMMKVCGYSQCKSRRKPFFRTSPLMTNPRSIGGILPRPLSNSIKALQEYYPIDSEARPLGGAFSVERRYRQLALAACDIIDLANLPESDRHIATRQLELRRLYVPLRVRIEPAKWKKTTAVSLKAIEPRSNFAAKFSDESREDISKQIPIGKRLAKVKRLVVLGDPGAGKLTMLRWVATAYLLRLKQDPDWKQLPDVATLPQADWLPILLRCQS